VANIFINGPLGSLRACIIHCCVIWTWRFQIGIQGRGEGSVTNFGVVLWLVRFVFQNIWKAGVETVSCEPTYTLWNVFSSLANRFKDGLPPHYNLVAATTEHAEQLLHEFNRRWGEEFQKAFHLSNPVWCTVKTIMEVVNVIMEYSWRNTKTFESLFSSGTIGNLIAMNLFTLGANLYKSTW
jgi:hypothetical protein